MRWLGAQSRFLTSTGFLAKFWINTPIQTEEPLLMDFHGIEALLGLPGFRVINQVIRPDRLDVHLVRRDPSIVCPRCQTCCSRVKESRPRCLRDLPILALPVLLWVHMRRFECSECHHRPGRRARPSGRTRSGRSASTTRCARSSLGVVRAKNSPVATGSPHAPCFAGRLKGAVVDVPANSAAPSGLMNTQGVKGTEIGRAHV